MNNAVEITSAVMIMVSVAIAAAITVPLPRPKPVEIVLCVPTKEKPCGVPEDQRVQMVLIEVKAARKDLEEIRTLIKLQKETQPDEGDKK